MSLDLVESTLQNCKASEEHACVTDMPSLAPTELAPQCAWLILGANLDVCGISIMGGQTFPLGTNRKPTWKTLHQPGTCEQEGEQKPWKTSLSCVRPHHGLRFQKDRLSQKGSAELSPHSHWLCHSWVAVYPLPTGPYLSQAEMFQGQTRMEPEGRKERGRQRSERKQGRGLL